MSLAQHMPNFPNVRTESDFVRAYVHALSGLRSDISVYVAVHGFEKDKYDAVFSNRLGGLYMGLSEALTRGRISESTMTALAYLYSKEMLELAAECGHPSDGYELAAAEYAKVRHVVQSALDAE